VVGLERGWKGVGAEGGIGGHGGQRRALAGVIWSGVREGETRAGELLVVYIK
jgi:hypothetical protein